MKRGVLRVNPFADLPVSKSVGKRERVLSDQEIAEIWRAADDAAFPYGTIIRLLILTGQRRGEVAGMTWDELSRDLNDWNLSGERTKNGQPHSVPLSAPGRDILRPLLSQSETGKHGNSELAAPWCRRHCFCGVVESQANSRQGDPRRPR